ncbi:LysR family transcriptional regulator [Ferrimonas aestuarii]|uniref:LysR family transcriptional regulator n=1 Tax=Ferrimonas aestuarii TaxID=2569539 RepID=A0A4U1BPV0_9GAMM|nr:LysR family transcriptional regulator [Ferrimonas aestuarii]TKB56643.1 LysR family transcriptional regulator [Ferrimonas aestuarii]
MKTRSDDLEILLAVIDSGGFSAAAEQLNIQVARASRAVTRLEQQLGVSLLNRTTRRVELTEEGRGFVEGVRLGLGQLTQAEDALQSQQQTPKGTLRVDAASPFMQHQIVPLIPEFTQLYPDIQLDLTCNEGYVDLLEKRTDLAIRIGPLADSSLHARHLGRSALHIVATPSYLDQHGKPQSIDQLKLHPLIGFANARRLNRWPLAGLGEIKPSIGCSNGEVIKQLTLTHCGIACLSNFMVEKELTNGSLLPLFADDLVPNTDRESVNAVYYRSSALSSRIGAFLDFIEPRLSL